MRVWGFGMRVWGSGLGFEEILGLQAGYACYETLVLSAMVSIIGGYKL